MPEPAAGAHAGVMASELQTLSNELADAVQKAAPGIVAVLGRRGIGSSGIAWGENLIVTSNEGVRGEEGIKILLPDGRATTARLRGRDSGTDLALLEIEAGGLPALNFADESAVKAGQLAIAVGRTANTGPIASFGIVSGVSGEWKTWRGGKLDPFVRLDISAYPTLSGGAALDASGHLIGMVSTGLSRSSIFAVTRGTIDRIAGKLSQQGYVSRGFLGVALQPVALPPQLRDHLGQDSGIMLLGIEPEGPASLGGLILGDVLVAADGQSLAQPESLADLLERTPLGQNVKFKVLRAGVVQEQEVRIGERPARRR